MNHGVVEDRFRAMGSDIHLVVVGGTADMLSQAWARIEVLEQRWSRFRPDSEICRLNAAAGESLVVTADTLLLVQRAIDAWRLTGGGFDPTLLDALVAAGYDRTFDELHDDGAVGAPPMPRLSIVRPGVTDIVIERDAVMLPAGMGFDPGGIGKGLSADIVATEVIQAGAAGVCVNMGGDLRVLGESPTGTGWTLAIEHPWSAQPIALVGLWDGAVATSSVLRKVWTVNGRRRHHLMDPQTEQPSESDLALVSVIAGQTWIAEVLAKAVLLRGRERAFDLLDADAAALAVDHAGGVTASETFAAYLGGAALTDSVQFDR